MPAGDPPTRSPAAHLAEQLERHFPADARRRDGVAHGRLQFIGRLREAERRRRVRDAADGELHDVEGHLDEVEVDGVHAAPILGDG
ncbi:MAG: hypothetical protein U0P30_01665 [Vicinamibacterales bacterium]